MRCTWRNHAKSTSNGNYCLETTSSKGIASTIYDPRKVDDRAINWEKNNLLKERLAEKNNKTPFFTCVPPKYDGKKVNTHSGMNHSYLFT